MNDDTNKEVVSVEASTNGNAADIVKIDDSEYNISQMDKKYSQYSSFFTKTG
jgi:hypothetical protein